MKKSEKILSAVVLMALGVLFIILQDNFIGILMTLVGAWLITLGIIDFVQRAVPQATVKIISGILLIVAGWALVTAVLYILSGLLLIFGILWLYDKIKVRRVCSTLWQTLLEYLAPAVCIAIGIILLFHGGEMVGFVIVFSGVLTVIEGGILLVQALADEE